MPAACLTGLWQPYILRADLPFEHRCGGTQWSSKDALQQSGLCQAATIACRRAALALAAGCIYRSKGGMALQRAVALTADTLVAVAQQGRGTLQLWALHGLWLTANAAGLAFVPHVRVSLGPSCVSMTGWPVASLWAVQQWA